jgi:hypothetical protein
MGESNKRNDTSLTMSQHTLIPPHIRKNKIERKDWRPYVVLPYVARLKEMKAQRDGGPLSAGGLSCFQSPIQLPRQTSYLSPSGPS